MASKVREFSIDLERDSPQIPWGIRLVGGSDLNTPLIITKVWPILLLKNSQSEWTVSSKTVSFCMCVCCFFFLFSFQTKILFYFSHAMAKFLSPKIPMTKLIMIVKIIFLNYFSFSCSFIFLKISTDSTR